jgi:hypothetical protein
MGSNLTMGLHLLASVAWIASSEVRYSGRRARNRSERGSVTGGWRRFALTIQLVYRWKADTMSASPLTRKCTLRIGLAVATVLVVALALVTQLSATSYTSVQDAVRAHGATVHDAGLGSQPFLRGVDHRLNVNGVGVDGFEYRTTVEASLDAGRASADGSTIGPDFGPLGGTGAVIDFVAPPHLFHAGRVVVLYVGQDEGILTLLRMTLGAQCASSGV